MKFVFISFYDNSFQHPEICILIILPHYFHNFILIFLTLSHVFSLVTEVAQSIKP